MEKKSLIFFNKEGLPINTVWSEPLKAWTAKLMFDHNGPDTFKTIGLYAFEKVPAHKLTSELEFYPIQEYASGTVKTHASKQWVKAASIYESNTSSQFYTKWLESEEPLDNVNIGDVLVPQVNVNGPEFYTQVNGDTNYFVVLRKENNRVLVKTSVNNYNYANKTSPTVFESVNYISWPVNSVDNINQLQVNDKFTLSGAGLADSVYTVKMQPATKRVNEITLNPNEMSLIVGGKLELKVTLNDARPAAYNGSMILGSISNSSRISFGGNVAPIVKVGDIIVIRSNSEQELLEPNFYDLVVTAVDKDLKWIDVSENLAEQNIDATIYLRKKTLSFEHNVLTSPVFGSAFEQPDNEATLKAFLDEHADMLSAYNMHAFFDTTTGSLVVKNKLPEDYIAYEYFSNNTSIKQGTVRDHWIIPVKEPIVTSVCTKKHAKYSRTLVFNEIDNFGLNISINNTEFSTKRDDSVNKTLTDWLEQHAVKLNNIGVHATVSSNKLIISAKYPDVSVRVKTRMGDASSYYTEHSSCTYKNISKSLTVKIAGALLSAELQDDIASTIDTWISNNHNKLKDLQMVATRSGDTLILGTLDPERIAKVEFLDARTQFPIISGVKNLRTENVCTVIASTRINSYGSTNFISSSFATGQIISVSDIEPSYLNKHYTIIDVSDNRMLLSYQGASTYYYGQTTIESSEFLREPRSGYEGGNPVSLTFRWDDTDKKDMFLYDFSERQLSDDVKAALAKNNISPILENGQVRLNTKTTIDSNGKVSVDKVQTVFEEIKYKLEKVDSDTDITAEPEPLQVFVGYKGDDEGVDRAKLLVELKEERVLKISTTNTSDVINFHDDNRITFSGTSMVSNGSDTNFVNYGFKPGQKIRLKGGDNNLDGRNLLTFKNAGKEFEILEVRHAELVLKPLGADLVNESTTNKVAAFIAPYYIDGLVRKIDRFLDIEIEQLPELVAVIDLLGQTEVEDERFKMDLDSYGRNISMNDLFILKNYEGIEAGVDWPILNRKRKEMLMLHRDIYDYVSTYKSILTAIDFWGYNDLDLIEYYVNLDPSSDGFGKLYSDELVRIFNGTQTGWRRNNVKKLNENLKKTNMFSLSYKLTDGEGNYIEGYNFDELYNKLFGLQQWLEDNVLPMDVRMLDINGKIQTGGKNTLSHLSFIQHHLTVTGTHAPITSNVNGYLSPITDYAYPNYDMDEVYKTDDIVWYEGEEWIASMPEVTSGIAPKVVPLGTVPGSVEGSSYWTSLGTNHSKPYNVTVDFSIRDGYEMPGYFHVKITTYSLTKWEANGTYRIDEPVYHNGKFYLYSSINGSNVEPGSDLDATNPTWTIPTDEAMRNKEIYAVQFIEKTLYDMERVTFSVNRAIDPLFIVSVYSDNGMSMGWVDRKVYTVGPLLEIPKVYHETATYKAFCANGYFGENAATGYDVNRNQAIAQENAMRKAIDAAYAGLRCVAKPMIGVDTVDESETYKDYSAVMHVTLSTYSHLPLVAELIEKVDNVEQARVELEMEDGTALVPINRVYPKKSMPYDVTFELVDKFDYSINPEYAYTLMTVAAKLKPEVNINTTNTRVSLIDYKNANVIYAFDVMYPAEEDMTIYYKVYRNGVNTPYSVVLPANQTYVENIVPVTRPLSDEILQMVLLSDVNYVKGFTDTKNLTLPEIHRPHISAVKTFTSRKNLEVAHSIDLNITNPSSSAFTVEYKVYADNVVQATKQETVNANATKVIVSETAPRTSAPVAYKYEVVDKGELYKATGSPVLYTVAAAVNATTSASSVTDNTTTTYVDWRFVFSEALFEGVTLNYRHKLGDNSTWQYDSVTVTSGVNDVSVRKEYTKLEGQGANAHVEVLSGTKYTLGSSVTDVKTVPSQSMVRLATSAPLIVTSETDTTATLSATVRAYNVYTPMQVQYQISEDGGSTWGSILNASLASNPDGNEVSVVVNKTVNKKANGFTAMIRLVDTAYYYLGSPSEQSTSVAAEAKFTVSMNPTYVMDEYSATQVSVMWKFDLTSIGSKATTINYQFNHDGTIINDSFVVDQNSASTINRTHVYLKKDSASPVSITILSNADYAIGSNQSNSTTIMAKPKVTLTSNTYTPVENNNGTVGVTYNFTISNASASYPMTVYLQESGTGGNASRSILLSAGQTTASHSKNYSKPTTTDAVATLSLTSDAVYTIGAISSANATIPFKPDVYISTDTNKTRRVNTGSTSTLYAEFVMTKTLPYDVDIVYNWFNHGSTGSSTTGVRIYAGQTSASITKVVNNDGNTYTLSIINTIPDYNVTGSNKIYNIPLIPVIDFSDDITGSHAGDYDYNVIIPIKADTTYHDTVTVEIEGSRNQTSWYPLISIVLDAGATNKAVGTLIAKESARYTLYMRIKSGVASYTKGNTYPTQPFISIPNEGPVGGGSGSCLAAGTMVTMSDGTYKSIEELLVGDFVQSYDIEGLDPDNETNEYLESWSSSNFKYTPSIAEIMSVDAVKVESTSIFNNKIESSQSHIHFIYDGANYVFKTTANVIIGDSLVLEDGSLEEITKIDLVPGEQTVYLINAERFDVFVANGYITHNKVPQE